ncbi:MAG TPA: hypothetical protein VIY48_01940 [Candidatus Paceibacterota bacterium]
MRDLSKTKVTAEWAAKDGTIIMQLHKGKRGAEYISFIHRFPDGKPYYRDFRDMRMSQLTEAARMIGDYLTEEKVEQRVAEIALDLIYAELNRRLTK